MINIDTVESAFNVLGYNEISEFLNIHFFKSALFNKDEGEQDFIFPWSLEFRQKENVLYNTSCYYFNPPNNARNTS